MNNRMCEMFGIDVPIFAFSHCRDVVVEVSKAGGLGVLGMGRMSPQLAGEALKWVDDHIGGRPYGIDLMMPTTYQDPGELKFDSERLFPQEQLQFVRKMLDDAGIPRLPEAEAAQIERELLTRQSYTREESAEMLEIAMQHPIKLIVNALGSPPREQVERAHARGIKVAAMAGVEKHAIKHKQAGCDFVIATGTEAGGHVGSTTSLVLWPRIVDAVAPLPVLGAGGVGRGRQIAAALALGCEGVWCGSVWLKTAQSEVIPEMKAKLFNARSEDTVLTLSVSGKNCRALRCAYTDAWDKPGAPAPLAPAQQHLLFWGQCRSRAERVRATEFLAQPVGQIVGDMKEETSVRQVVYDMLNELLESKEQLDKLLA